MSQPLTTLRPHPESPLPWFVSPQMGDPEGFADINASDGMSVATNLWIEDAEFIVALVNAALPMAAEEGAHQLGLLSSIPSKETK